MFGIKLRSWMESHIVRPRKKQQQQQQQQQQQRNKDGTGSKAKANGKVVPDRALLDSAGNSPTSPVVTKKNGTHKSQHVLRCDLNYGSPRLDEEDPCDKDVEAIALSNHQPRPHHHQQQAPPPPQHQQQQQQQQQQNGYTANNLSSPESAYSTGYSTDGTSPGTSFPPEYYINLRTGTHYFHSASTNPTAPGQPGVLLACANGIPPSCRVDRDHRARNIKVAESSNPALHHHKPIPEALSADESQPPPSHSHRRTESCDESRRYPGAIRTSFVQLDDAPPISPVPTSSGHLLVGAVLSATPSHAANGAQVTASPRQRNRIRTNPWVASNKATPPNTAQGESSSSYGSGSDVTLPRSQQLSASANHVDIIRSPPQRSWIRPQPGTAMARRDSLCSSSSTTSSSHTATNPSDLSEDDLTLNEMLGKYDESYVYEKETDILSDSDPTDCDEDYGDTDFDTGQDGGDEHDPQDDEELDFIDNGSYLELNPADLDDGTDKSASSNGIVNKGHCTYHMPSDFVRKPAMRFRESFLRRSSCRHNVNKDESSGSPGPSSRHPSVRKGGEDGHAFNRRSTREGSKHRRDANWGNSASGPLSRPPSEKKRLRCSMRRKCSVRDRVPASNPVSSKSPANIPNNNLVNDVDRVKVPEIETAGVLNLNRVLMQKMLARSSVSGTRSAGNTPVSMRRRILNPNEPDSLRKTTLVSRLVTAEINYNNANCISDKNSNIEIPTSPNHFDEIQKRRSNSISCGVGSNDVQKAMPNANYLATFASELAIIEADKEAERKYKELILEAEQILVSMKGTIPARYSNFMIPRPKPFFLNSKYLVDDGHRYNGVGQLSSKLHEKIDFKTDCNSENNLKSCLMNKKLNSPKRILDGLAQKQNQSVENGNLRAFSPPNSWKEQNRTFNKEEQPDEQTDKEGPLSRSSSSESNGSTTPHQAEALSPTNPPPQRPPLMAFRSIDLGHEMGGSGYCPQSEPVKRKVYTCSATFDRLQKSLEKSQHQSLRLKADTDEKGGKGSLKEKLEQLRRERLEVEAKVREAQEEDRRRLDDKAQCQKQLSLLRRQMLVHTIEGLKRSLEDQSAKLHETFHPEDEENSSSAAEIQLDTSESESLRLEGNEDEGVERL